MKCKVLIGAVFIFLSIYATTYASDATLKLVPNKNIFTAGDSVAVRVVIDSAGTAVNAVSARVQFSSDVLQVVSISKQNSIISLWPKDPVFAQKDGVASFEGVILNPGFSGQGGTVATIYFKARAPGSAKISFIEASVLANDGLGTQLDASLVDTSFAIKAAAPQKVIEQQPKQEEAPKEQPVVQEKEPYKISWLPIFALGVSIVLIIEMIGIYFLRLFGYSVRIQKRRRI